MNNGSHGVVFVWFNKSVSLMFGYEGIVTWYQGLKVRWEQEQAKIERQEQEQVRARLKALNCKDEEICKAQARLHRKCEDYEEQIRMAESDKLTTLQGLRDQHTLSLQELHDYFDDKVWGFKVAPLLIKMSKHHLSLCFMGLTTWWKMAHVAR